MKSSYWVLISMDLAVVYQKITHIINLLIYIKYPGWP